MHTLSVWLVTMSWMALVGVGVIAGVPYVMPSLPAAFVDGGTFRSWMGFGIQEVTLQAALFAAGLQVWMAALRRAGLDVGGPGMARLVVAPWVIDRKTVFNV